MSLSQNINIKDEVISSGFARISCFIHEIPILCVVCSTGSHIVVNYTSFFCMTIEEATDVYPSCVVCGDTPTWWGLVTTQGGWLAPRGVCPSGGPPCSLTRQGRTWIFFGLLESILVLFGSRFSISLILVMNTVEDSGLFLQGFNIILRRCVRKFWIIRN